ncbi:hypothetical protein CXG81DRAFT_18921 [Caulochytrium protostelioides]|uniref:Deubiquitinating enzyme MINDY-3/4 conserved domain-containing protein n=1 Tax=Caulochytrium protostelioides TaxID=1555241 RepID=A0A4P9X858_9FUNG|nr:hypothetical protein CXG81DRAFT_18921 [Caulochytrium protostelioides]|eukprot:RKP01250.1 hypothetical protein CXG81DRAFT_18921 [Caulochytrium protostelioides]
MARSGLPRPIQTTSPPRRSLYQDGLAADAGSSAMPAMGAMGAVSATSATSSTSSLVSPLNLDIELVTQSLIRDYLVTKGFHDVLDGFLRHVHAHRPRHIKQRTELARQIQCQHAYRAMLALPPTLPQPADVASSAMAAAARKTAMTTRPTLLEAAVHQLMVAGPDGAAAGVVPGAEPDGAAAGAGAVSCHGHGHGSPARLAATAAEPRTPVRPLSGSASPGPGAPRRDPLWHAAQTSLAAAQPQARAIELATTPLASPASALALAVPSLPTTPSYAPRATRPATAGARAPSAAAAAAAAVTAPRRPASASCRRPSDPAAVAVAAASAWDTDSDDEALASDPQIATVADADAVMAGLAGPHARMGQAMAPPRALDGGATIGSRGRRLPVGARLWELARLLLGAQPRGLVWPADWLGAGLALAPPLPPVASSDAAAAATSSSDPRQLRGGLMPGDGAHAGFIAAVQAHLVQRITYHNPGVVRDGWSALSGRELERCLADAITQILWQAGGTRHRKVIVAVYTPSASALATSSSRPASASSSSSSSSASASSSSSSGAAAASMPKPRPLRTLSARIHPVSRISSQAAIPPSPAIGLTAASLLEDMVIHEFMALDDCTQFVLQNLNQFLDTSASSTSGSQVPSHAHRTNHGCINLLVSLALSRGIATLLDEDLDDRTSTLLDSWGRPTIALINLLLKGQALSNLFDGDLIMTEPPVDPDFGATDAGTGGVGGIGGIGAGTPGASGGLPVTTCPSVPLRSPRPNPSTATHPEGVALQRPSAASGAVPRPRLSTFGGHSLLETGARPSVAPTGTLTVYGGAPTASVRNDRPTRTASHVSIAPSARPTADAASDASSTGSDDGTPRPRLTTTTARTVAEAATARQSTVTLNGAARRRISIAPADGGGGGGGGWHDPTAAPGHAATVAAAHAVAPGQVCRGYKQPAAIGYLEAVFDPETESAAGGDASLLARLGTYCRNPRYPVFVVALVSRPRPSARGGASGPAPLEAKRYLVVWSADPHVLQRTPETSAAAAAKTVAAHGRAHGGGADGGSALGGKASKAQMAAALARAVIPPPAILVGPLPHTPSLPKFDLWVWQPPLPAAASATKRQARLLRWQVFLRGVPPHVAPGLRAVPPHSDADAPASAPASGSCRAAWQWSGSSAGNAQVLAQEAVRTRLVEEVVAAIRSRWPAAQSIVPAPPLTTEATLLSHRLS